MAAPERRLQAQTLILNVLTPAINPNAIGDWRSAIGHHGSHRPSPIAKLLGSLLILARRRIHLHLVARADELRHVDRDTILEVGRLRCRRSLARPRRGA